MLNEKGDVLPCEPNLAVLDLLRGYMLGLPTGQAVARLLIDKGRQVRVITADEIIGIAKKRSSEQVEILTASEFDFSERTPLWFYVLAEAELINQGKRLGPVGTTIVAEVLLGQEVLRQRQIEDDAEQRGSLVGMLPHGTVAVHRRAQRQARQYTEHTHRIEPERPPDPEAGPQRNALDLQPAVSVA